MHYSQPCECYRLLPFWAEKFPKQNIRKANNGNFVKPAENNKLLQLFHAFCIHNCGPNMRVNEKLKRKTTNISNNNWNEELLMPHSPTLPRPGYAWNFCFDMSSPQQHTHMTVLIQVQAPILHAHFMVSILLAKQSQVQKQIIEAAGKWLFENMFDCCAQRLQSAVHCFIVCFAFCCVIP